MAALERSPVGPAQSVTLAQEHHRDVRDQLQEARLALGCARGCLQGEVVTLQGHNTIPGFAFQ